MERVKTALLEIRSGNAAFERDSVLFETPQYRWPLIACLLRVASRSGELRALDFGGSLGSTYFQNRDFFSGLASVRWGVVEQEHFVECGKETFEDEVLSFHESIEDCVSQVSPEVALFSGVLQYLEHPHQVLEKVIELEIPYILLDRLSFKTGPGRDRLTVQKVPPEIYPASYPCWFFQREAFLALLEPKYSEVASFEGLDEANIPSTFEGFLFRRR